MADFVGRTIATNDGGNNIRPGAGSGQNRMGDRNMSFNTRLGASTIATDDIGHDVTRLYTIVETALMNMPANDAAASELRPTEAARMREMLSATWDAVREWLSAHPSQSDRQQAAMHQGQFLTTALHMVCKLNDPPVDIVNSLIECAEETVTWPDSNGWLPLHHACANGASGRVLSALVTAYPEGKVQQDKRFRTPLHFAFFRKDAHEDHRTVTATGKDGGLGRSSSSAGLDARGGGDGDDDDVGNSMPEIVRLLADSGAAELQDEGGMLPMHYASAYGTTREVLEVLLENYPESITKRENKGRNPLHLAMVNAHRKSSPKVVGFLLEKNAPEIINAYDDEHHLPIHLLAMASKFPEEKVLERKNAANCLTLYLNARPKASADFLTAVQTLPEWLRDIAVISDHIQNILNQKIVQRFPTMILILDAVCLLCVIVLFEVTTSNTINYLFTQDDAQPTDLPSSHEALVVITLIIGAYFLMRELVQIISLLALGNFSSWLWDTGNWLDVIVIFFIFFFGAIMLSKDPMMDKETFRSGVALTKGILWISVIFFLKSTRVEFSVFVSGVNYVVQRLAAFLLAMGVILLMFAQMFYIVYAESEECQCTKDYPDAEPFPHCNFKDSLMKVYTMLMGEIGNEMRYSTLPVAQFLYIAFAFLVVILLSNVLIAIVTDSYGVIKNERAAMVFWSNRLDFVAEMDAIKNVGKSIKKCFKMGGGTSGAPTRVQETPNGEPIPIEENEKESLIQFRNAWRSIMNLFDPNLYETYDVGPSSFEFWCYVLVRFAAVVFVIPIWLILGLCTAGWLWPPQVREYLLKQKKVAISRADMAEQVTAQINDLKNEIKKLRVEMKSEMKNDRKEFSQVKAEVEAVQAEVMADLLQVKEIMVTLLDMSRDHLGSGR
mmetsp:Transcript_45096/g.94562  ORF Transcript_45096/g.94562 Transcript_45096/m.94562 type:complete len:894 (+) Transcript_45096:64-2745(+)|eukprot:CAMPEP_0183703304 /NCGR_PEP_ID=MMETSP0737-20130205/1091_1 /TAXON_ID=385413 /ORGANISM="Thalassiosira miniscula, Strain CCMP1093" /LENGTH=893 /DNA_ID=CAMNT_0025930029 /DNA_START=63 /DNA_END=2744 /DNA_ORIENTATION=+